MNKPHLYITYFENLEPKTLGPYFTLSLDGIGPVIGQDWIGYEAQDESTRFIKITVPKNHYIAYK